MQQITDTIYLGDVNDALIASCSENFDIIIYLGQEIPTKLCFNCKPTCIHLPLIDGKNGQTKLRKVLFLTYMASLDNRLLISCRAGLSRSVLITTAVYALAQKISFEKAYQHIKKLRPQSFPELNLFQEVKQTTEELACCL